MGTKAELEVADGHCVLLMVYLRPAFPMPVALREAIGV